jgi:flagella basal body P-ring formation protein FlgA
MKILAFLVIFCAVASAEGLDTIVRDRVGAELPSNLGVAKVYAPAGYDAVDAKSVAVEVPRELRTGRASMKVTIKRKTLWVPVAIAPVSEVAIVRTALPAGSTIRANDIAIERRAIESSAPASPTSVVGSTTTRELAIGDAISSKDITLPRPLARGTQVQIQIRRGAVQVRGTGILELAARPGDAATARLAQTKTIVRGTLVAPATLVVGDSL